jgi:mxaJ protein
MCSRFLNALLLIAALVACGTAGAPPAPEPAPAAEPARALRVCADPNNLPFSNAVGEGFENQLAAALAASLDARLEYVWWAQRRGFIRNTLQAGACDVVMGVPSHFERVATTIPYYRSSYVFVTRPGEPAPASFDDPLLRQRLVGVQLIGDDFANTPPAHALTARHIVGNVRGYSIYGDYREPNPPAAIVRAVASHDIDVAIVWGPMGGYFARAASPPLTVTTVTPDHEGALPFTFDIAMAVDRSNPTLLREINTWIAAERPLIDSILDGYGVPRLPLRDARSAHAQ